MSLNDTHMQGCWAAELVNYSVYLSDKSSLSFKLLVSFFLTSLNYVLF